jgi:uncharacterized protein (UPF0147 family)
LTEQFSHAFDVRVVGFALHLDPKVNTYQSLYNLVHCEIAVGGPSMVRKKKTEEYEERVKQALVVLGQVSEDSTTPRNIRRAAKDSMNALQSGEYTNAVRASNVISILDEILQDPNMPAYTRVKLWNIMSLIEAIKD